jgi:multiple sugar transport system permease protein
MPPADRERRKRYPETEENELDSPRRWHLFQGYLFVAPVLLILGVTVIYPVIYNTAIAFYSYSPVQNTWRFAGVEKFGKIFSSPTFWQSSWTTLIWVVGSVGTQMGVGMAVALALNRVRGGRAFLSGLFLVPWISSYVIVAILWLWVYHPQLGVFNDILMKLHLISKPILWLNTPGLALFSLILTNCWKFFPLVMLTLFAGLQGIPKDFYEVAAVEGATPTQTFRWVILPSLLPSISIAILVATIWAYNSFTLPFIMTSGGPLRGTEILGLYIYKEAFDAYDFGAAAAGSIFLFFQIFIIIFFYVRSVGRDVG